MFAKNFGHSSTQTEVQNIPFPRIHRSRHIYLSTNFCKHLNNSLTFSHFPTWATFPHIQDIAISGHPDTCQN